MAVLASIELEKGKTERGQFLYDEAYLHSNIRELAKAKDPIAQFCIGLMEMDNPPRNIEKGIRSLERAADQGLATAQATLGMIYFTGIGAPRDPQEALKWCSLLPVKIYLWGCFTWAWLTLQETEFPKIMIFPIDGLEVLPSVD